MWTLHHKVQMLHIVDLVYEHLHIDRALVRGCFVGVWVFDRAFGRDKSNLCSKCRILRRCSVVLFCGLWRISRNLWSSGKSNQDYKVCRFVCRSVCLCWFWWHRSSDLCSAYTPNLFGTLCWLCTIGHSFSFWEWCGFCSMHPAASGLVSRWQETASRCTVNSGWWLGRSSFHSPLCKCDSESGLYHTVIPID